MSYQYSDYPYNLQADEMFDFTDVSTPEMAAALNEYQNLIINGQIDAAAQYLRDDTTGLKNCLIGAEVINTLQQRIHAVQDYALSLKTQGWYSEENHDPDASIRLKGTMFRVKTGEYDDGVITDEYIKTETGGDYVKHYSNGLIYYNNGILEGISPIGSSPMTLDSSTDGSGNIDVDLKLWNNEVLTTRLPLVTALQNILPSILPSLAATGVKGKNETTYRTGRVNLTPANIGAVNTEGDSMTGSLKMLDSKHIDLYATNSSTDRAGYIYANTNQYVALASSGTYPIRISSSDNIMFVSQRGSENEAAIEMSADSGQAALYPAGGTDRITDISLGMASYKWGSIYAKDGTIHTSDKNEKHDIKPIQDVFEKLFMKLTPVSYVFNDGKRTHIGFISQDVEAAMEELGLTSTDFAGFCKDEVDGQTYYGLRYSEFIALNTHMIQKLMKRVENLESRQ